MKFEQALVIYSSRRFKVINGKLYLPLKLSQYMMESYERESRTFNLEVDELYDLVHDIAKTIHTDDSTSIEDDLTYNFCCEKKNFVLNELRKYLFTKFSLINFFIKFAKKH